MPEFLDYEGVRRDRPSSVALWCGGVSVLSAVIALILFYFFQQADNAERLHPVQGFSSFTTTDIKVFLAWAFSLIVCLCSGLLGLGLCKEDQRLAIWINRAGVLFAICFGGGFWIAIKYKML
jgi:uncharacterized membrane protein